jgi:hypothetical protein
MKRRRAGHSTVPSQTPPRRAQMPKPPRTRRAAPPKGVSRPRPAPRREAARIVDQSESSLVDVIDNLLNRGVVLNADVILALADIDLVYLRLSALLCAADRLLGDAER